MKAIKKLNIVFRIAILAMIIPFFYFQFKSNIAWGIAFAIILAIFILSRLFIFKKRDKYWKDLEDDYTWAPLGYVFGGVFFLMAILASFGTISDINQGAPIPLWVMIGFPALWIFGFLLMYYAYKSQKESSLVTKKIIKKQKPEDIISKDKTKRFWIYYWIAFMVIATIIGFMFDMESFTLFNVIISLAVIIFMFLYLKMVLPTGHEDPKKKKYRVFLVILIFLLIFLGVFTYTFIVTHNKIPSERCVSKGIFPKNGIPGLQYCEEDSDCVKVIERDSCCDACHGGKNNAINKKHIDFWECVRLKDKNCNNILCSENVTSQSCFAEARCVNNICEIIREPARYDLNFSNFGIYLGV